MSILDCRLNMNFEYLSNNFSFDSQKLAIDSNLHVQGITLETGIVTWNRYFNVQFKICMAYLLVFVRTLWNFFSTLGCELDCYK